MLFYHWIGFKYEKKYRYIRKKNKYFFQSITMLLFSLPEKGHNSVLFYFISNNRVELPYPVWMQENCHVFVPKGKMLYFYIYILVIYVYKSPRILMKQKSVLG